MKKFLIYSILALMTGMAFAQQNIVEIVNGDFETDALADAGITFNPTGWTTTTGNGAADLWAAVMPGDVAESGQGNSAFANANGWLLQSLPVTLKADHTYELTYKVGRRLDNGTSGYRIELMVNPNAQGVGTVLAATTSSPLAPIGSWVTGNLVFTPPAGHAELGQNLVVKLTSLIGQTNFDDIAVTESLPGWVPAADQIHYQAGNVGIGTNTPDVSLDVAGAVKIGNTQSGDAVSAGVMRYNAVINCMEFYNGTQWRALCGVPSIDPRLIVHYTFDDDTALGEDSSDNQLDAVNNGGLAETDSVIGNGAINFGAGDYLDLSSQISSMPSPSTGTITGWIRTTAAGGAIFEFSKYNGSTDTAFSFFAGDITGSYNDECLTIGYRTNDTLNLAAYARGCDTTLLDGDWHHVALVMDAAGHALYLDGNPLQITHDHGTANTGNLFLNMTGAQFAAFGIRKQHGTLTSHLAGDMDDMRIWDETLTGAEIQALYDAGAP